MPLPVEDVIRRAETTSAPDAGESAAAPVFRPRRFGAEPGTILSQTVAVIERERLSALGAFSVNQAWTIPSGLDQAIADNTGLALAAVVPARMYASGIPATDLVAATGLGGALDAANARQLQSTDLHILSGTSPAALAAADWESRLTGLVMGVPQEELSAAAHLAGMGLFDPSQAFASNFLQGPHMGIDLPMTLGSPFTGVGPEAWGAFATLPPISWLEPGTPDGDLFLLMRGDADPAQHLAALGRMANRIPWAPRPAAWDALVKRARRESTSVDTIKRQELQAAIVIVLGAVDQPHYYRFGREWLKGDDGHKVAVTPLHLELDRIWEWFYNEVRKAAEAALLEVPYPHVTRDVFHRKDSDGRRICLPFDQVLLPEPANDPLILLLDRERRTEDEERLLAVLKRASPGQRQLLALIAEGNTEAAAAQILGIAPSTARVQLYRLRKKVV
jgi:DNA-binding CsgD family transcriptional regulator